MLTSITPLGERGRGQRWGLTATWLTVGHLLGGLALGAVMAVLGGLRSIAGLDLSSGVTVSLIAGATIAAAGFDLAGGRLPGRRQVDERWLSQYRGWVYGLTFGAQLGLGFVTVVNTALFLAMVVAGALVGPPVALGFGLLYGATRAAMALLNARVRTVEQLKALHYRLDRFAPTVRVGSVAVTGLCAAAAVIVV